MTLTGGFAPGRTYELSYRPAKFPVSGLGMAAFRDVATWVKRSPDALARAPKTIAFGSSQSGRFLRTFLYYGFNSDEQGQQVFDGVMAHIAGGARLSLNERGADAQRAVDVRRRHVPVHADARSAIRSAAQTKGCSTTNARDRQSAEDLLHEHLGRVLGRRPRGRARCTRAPTASPICRCRTTCARTSSPARSTGRRDFRRE